MRPITKHYLEDPWADVEQPPHAQAARDSHRKCRPIPRPLQPHMRDPVILGPTLEPSCGGSYSFGVVHVSRLVSLLQLRQESGNSEEWHHIWGLSFDGYKTSSDCYACPFKNFHHFGNTFTHFHLRQLPQNFMMLVLILRHQRYGQPAPVCCLHSSCTQLGPVLCACQPKKTPLPLGSWCQLGKS